jgi:formate/nitrite transporter FocA (FNT family)
LLGVAYKLKLKPYAYFDTVNYGTLFLGNLMYSLQLISFCIMNAQLFDSNVRAIIFTLAIYLISSNIFSYTILWPLGIQYLLMFFVPFITGQSLFQVRHYSTTIS